jgi:hypothetical protein
MIGQKLNYSTIGRDHLVQYCKSASVADIFERVLKEEPQANRERVTERLTGAGVSDSAKIIKEVDDYIEIHNAGLKNALNILGVR